MKKNMTLEEANALSAPAETLTLGDREIKIYRVRVQHVGPFFSALGRILDQLQVDVTGTIKANLNDAGFLMQLIANSSRDVNQLLAMLTDLSRDEVESLELDEGIILIQKVFEVNQRFFVEKVKPHLGHLGGLLPKVE